MKLFKFPATIQEKESFHRFLAWRMGLLDDCKRKKVVRPAGLKFTGYKDSRGTFLLFARMQSFEFFTIPSSLSSVIKLIFFSFHRTRWSRFLPLPFACLFVLIIPLVLRLLFAFAPLRSLLSPLFPPL